MRKLIFVLLIFISCNQENTSNSNRMDKKNKTDSASILNKDTVESSKLCDDFLVKNYLKINRIFCGDVYTDKNILKDVFFRVLEITEEEHTELYVEKISIGEEGGRFELLKRIKITEQELGIRNNPLYIDSLKFIDSVHVMITCNKENYRVKLDDK